MTDVITVNGSTACHKRSVPNPGAFDGEVLHERIARGLEQRFAGLVPANDLSRISAEAVDTYRSSLVTNFIPILAQRKAVELASQLVATRTNTP